MLRASLVLATCLVPGLALAGDAPPLSIYGFARLDLLAEDARTSDLERPRFVEREAIDEGDGAFALHPRLSRIGLSVDAWRFGGPLAGTGLLEVDFQNGAPGAAGVRLRHAYVDITADEVASVLLGQTWDLVSPLLPSTHQDTLLGGAGNLGWLRPQIRLSILPSRRLRVAAAIAQPGPVDGGDLDGDGRADGSETGVPMLQWLVEVRVPGGGGADLRLGAWGHAGRATGADGVERAGYSAGGHLLAPVGARWTVLGELHGGTDLGDLRGTRDRAMPGARAAWGGWLELAFVPTERHMLAAGSSQDRTVGEVADGARVATGTVYAVHRYRPVESLQLGLELSRWSTDYARVGRAVAHRFGGHVTAYF